MLLLELILGLEIELKQEVVKSTKLLDQVETNDGFQFLEEAQSISGYLCVDDDEVDYNLENDNCSYQLLGDT